MSNLGVWDIEDFFLKIEVIHELNKELYDTDLSIRGEFNNVTRLVDNSKLNAEQATAGKIAYQLETAIEITETMKNRLILQLYGKHEVLVDRPLPIFFVDDEQQIQHKLDIYTNLR